MFQSLNKTELILCVSGSLVGIGVLSLWNWHNIDAIETKYQLGAVVSFGIVMSLMTSLPEFAYCFFLFRKKEIKTGVSVIFGSSLLNWTLLLLNNVIHPQNIFEKQTGLITWQLLCTTAPILLSILINTFLKGNLIKRNHELFIYKSQFLNKH